MKRFAIALTACLVLSLGLNANASPGSTTIILQDANGVGIPNVELNAYASSNTQVRIKTDANGRAVLQALRGQGSLEINHCVQAAESIALQMFDVDYGQGGGSFTLRLPARTQDLEYELRTVDGAKISRFEEVAFHYTPIVSTWVSDFGTFETPFGVAEISSCGEPWISADRLRVAPFSSSESEPVIRVEERIEGGTTSREYPTKDFTPGQVKPIVVNNFRFIEIQPLSGTVFQGQPIRVSGLIKGVASADEISSNEAFFVVCAKRSSPQSMTSRAVSNSRRDGLAVTQNVIIDSSGVNRCILTGSSRDVVSSFAFNISVQTKRQFANAANKRYRSCAALNRVFDGGLARSAAAQSANGSGNRLASVSASGYSRNSSLDRDRDGVACER